MTKREFLTAGIGTGVAMAKGSAAFAQEASPATRKDSGQGELTVIPRSAAKRGMTGRLLPGLPRSIPGLG